MGVVRSNPIALIALIALAGCGAAEPEVDANVVADLGLPAEEAAQTTSNLAAEAAEPVPGVSWVLEPTHDRDELILREADGHASLVLSCGGSPARFYAHVPGFTPSASGETMRLAIGPTEIGMVTGRQPNSLSGSQGEAAIPPNLPELLAAARAIDVVQGVQRIGATPPPPREPAQAFASACVARDR